MSESPKQRPVGSVGVEALHDCAPASGEQSLDNYCGVKAPAQREAAEKVEFVPAPEHANGSIYRAQLAFC